MGRFSGSKKPKYSSQKLQRKLKSGELQLVDTKAYNERCQLELSVWRPLQTFTDCVSAGEALFNGMMSGARTVKEISTAGYILAIQLQALKLQKSERDPSAQLSDRIKLADAAINMTKEEMHSLVFSTATNLQINILNKAADRPDMTQARLEVDLSNEDIPQMLKDTLIDAQKEAEHEFLDILLPEEDILHDEGMAL